MTTIVLQGVRGGVEEPQREHREARQADPQGGGQGRQAKGGPDGVAPQEEGRRRPAIGSYCWTS